MKRSALPNTSSRTKVAHRHTCFIDLPTTVIELTLRHLSAADSISLSCVNTRYRLELCPFVFKRARTSWFELIRITKDPSLLESFSFRQHTTQIRIVDFYSYGEWQVDIFSALHRGFPRLVHLLVNSANLSNWLKYRSSLSISRLTLYYETGHNETQDLQTEPNPKNIVKLSKTVSASPRIFDLSHLGDFVRVAHLLLDAYHFNWSPHEPAPARASLVQLSDINLINCTWEYPFTLAQFNPRGCLRSIRIKYTQNHPFILLERFNAFLESPSLSLHPGVHLQTLAISFEGYTDHTWRKILLMKQLAKFGTTYFPKLQRLELVGFQMNMHSLQTYGHVLDKEFCLYNLALKVFDMLKEDTNIETHEATLQHALQHKTRLQLGILH